MHNFGTDVSNKAFLKKLRHLAQEQRKVEEYLGTPYEEREYKKELLKNEVENVAALAVIAVNQKKPGNRFALMILATATLWKSNMIIGAKIMRRENEVH